MLNSFDPPVVLGNRHMQSIMASLKIRKPFVYRKAKNMLKNARTVIVDCGGGVRLGGKYSCGGKENRNLAVLIHGWEGSVDSMYLISAAGYLFDRGFDVFRLNLRDHGDTHHLNRGIFHSCRIDEVVGAVKRIGEMFPHERLCMGGFSLGGNFSIRVAMRAPENGFRLNRVVAVSPVIVPAKTMKEIETGFPVYNGYFLKKWRRSLFRKRMLFPELTDLTELEKHDTIALLTDFLVSRFTDFPDTAAYFKGYTLTDEAMKKLEVPVHIIAGADDPVIPVKDVDALPRTDFLHIEILQKGGHCGFLKNWRLESLAEERMAELFLKK